MKLQITDGVLTKYIPDGQEQEILIPASVTRIDENVFAQQPYIRYVYLPDSVKRIGRGAFLNCPNLREVRLSKRLQLIESHAFLYCGKLERMHFPEGLQYIGDGAFRQCSSLEDVQIPKTLVYVGVSAFAETPWYKALPGPLVMFNRCLVDYRGHDTALEIPAQMTQIGSDAFRNQHQLTSVTIPESVQWIGSNAFAASGLTSITFPPSLKVIPHSCCASCKSLEAVTLPDGLQEIQAFAFAECPSLHSITIPESVRRIDLSAFKRCSLQTITLFGIPFRTIGSVPAFALGGKQTSSISCGFYGDRGDVAAVFEMLETKNFALEVNMGLKCAAIAHLYLQTKDEAAAGFLAEHFTEVLHLLIDHNQIAAIQRLLDASRFAERETIEEAIGYANARKRLELQVLLINYKNEHFGFSDPTSHLKL